MIFRTWQGRHATELHQVDRQLALDNLDIAQNRFRRIAGEPDNIARNNGGADVLPLQQHLAILSDLVLLLLLPIKVSWVMLSSPMKPRTTPALPTLSIK